MLFVLAFRNVARNFRRLAPMIVTLVLASALMLAGNAILSYSRDSLFSTFAGTVAGDLSVSATPEGSQFTIFGSDALLVGEFLVPPVMVDFPDLDRFVQNHPAVSASSPVVTAVSRIEFMGAPRNRTVLGVDFDRHWSTFPDIELVAGRFPETGERALVVQENWLRPVVLGNRAVMTTVNDFSFTIRELPVVGVFRFPVDDGLLNRIVFADADTVRSLNGFVFGAGSTTEIADDDQDALDGDFDDLFAAGDAFDHYEDTDFKGFDFDNLFAESDVEARTEQQTVDGAWNFLLIRVADSARVSEVRRDLARAGFTPDSGYQVRDWQATVGGNAQIVWFLQILFNAGIVFVAIGAMLVTTNALVLSVLERTAEIGSMRALGATRARVAALMVVESATVVIGSAVFGLLFGAAGITLLGAAEIQVANPFLAILFGGEAIQGRITATLVVFHALAAAALALLVLVYPLKKAFSIQPVEAMSQ